MKIAWNEIKYQPKKFILIEVLIVIMMFMVIFLSGLTNGLGRTITVHSFKRFRRSDSFFKFYKSKFNRN